MKKKKNRAIRVSASVRERYSVVPAGNGGWSSVAAMVGARDERGCGMAAGTELVCR